MHDLRFSYEGAPVLEGCSLEVDEGELCMATRSAMKIAATARLDSDVELASSVSATRVSLGHPSLELGRIIGGHPMHDLEVDCVHSPGHLEG